MAIVAWFGASVYVAACIGGALTGVKPDQGYFYQHTYSGTLDDITEVDDDVRPVFRPTQQNVSVDLGHRAVLRCRVENLGAKIVTWRRVGDIHPMTIGLFTFVSDPRVSIEYNKRSAEWCLTINDVRHTDQGLYKCQINAKDDQYNFYNVMLHVKTLQVYGTGVVERGAEIRLLCNATGRPDPPNDVEWLKDSRVIESDEQAGLQITKKIEAKTLISALVIIRSKMTDAGDYYCRSSDNDIDSLAVRVINAPVEKRGASEEKTIAEAAHYRNRTNCSAYSLLTLVFVLIVSLLSTQYVRLTTSDIAITRTL